jgi:hypothetical protein
MLNCFHLGEGNKGKSVNFHVPFLQFLEENAAGLKAYGLQSPFSYDWPH